MTSTNKTTNYDLSQYVGSDKPTYLTDYNQDMSKIDAGIHAAKVEADTNSDSIGTLSSLTTESKNNLVAAINEVDAHADTNAGNIATNTSNIATNTTHIGTVANLTTTAKTDLVQSNNEINAKVGNIANLDTSVKTSTVGAINELYSELQKFNLTTFKTYDGDSTATDITIPTGIGIASGSGITVARNTDGSIFKCYGYLNMYINVASSGVKTIVLKNTGLQPAEEFIIKSCGILIYRILSGNVDTDNGHIYQQDITVKSNGNVEISINLPQGSHQIALILYPCLYFAKNFGDTPSQ